MQILLKSKNTHKKRNKNICIPPLHHTPGLHSSNASALPETAAAARLGTLGLWAGLDPPGAAVAVWAVATAGVAPPAGWAAAVQLLLSSGVLEGAAQAASPPPGLGWPPGSFSGGWYPHFLDQNWKVDSVPYPLPREPAGWA